MARAVINKTYFNGECRARPLMIPRLRQQVSSVPQNVAHECLITGRAACVTPACEADMRPVVMVHVSG